MSAVLKEVVTSENTNIAELLVVGEQMPADFYINSDTHKKWLGKAIDQTKDLVYPVDDEGIKEGAEVVTSINVLVRKVTSWNAAAYKQETEAAASKRSEYKVLLDTLSANGARIKDQAAEQLKKKLDDIKIQLLAEIDRQRTELGIRNEFINLSANLTPIVKLSGTLTPKGALTTKAAGFLKNIVNGELFYQQQHDGRLLILENRCLREEINPPLSPEYIGAAFKGTDEEFNARVEALIKIELDRRAETIARVERENAAANQKKIDDALKAQQAEANRLAKEAAEQERQAKALEQQAIDAAKPKTAQAILEETPITLARVTTTTSASLRESADRIEQSAQYADRSSDRNKEFAVAASLRRDADELEKQQAVITAQHQDGKPVEIKPGKRLSRFSAEFVGLENTLLASIPDDLKKILKSVTLNFEVSVPERITDKGVQDHFMSKLNDDLGNSFKRVSFHHVVN